MYSGGENVRNASGHQSENEQERKKNGEQVTGTHTTFPS